MKKRIKAISFVMACVLTCYLLSGCVCDGTEKTFREVDRKYAKSTGAVLVAYVPVVGWIAYPFLAWYKHLDYVAVLHKQPASPEFEVLRWDNRLIISPITKTGKPMYY